MSKLIKNIQKKAEALSKKYNPKYVSPYPFENVSEQNKNLEMFLTTKLPKDVSGAIVYADSKYKDFSKHY